MEKEKVINYVNRMYDAAICAVCQCDDNPEGLYPCDCSPENTSKRSKVISMLVDIKKEIINDIKFKNK